MGVTALGVSLISQIQKVLGNAEIVLMIGHKSSKQEQILLPDNTSISVKIVNYRLSPKSKISEHAFSIIVLAIIWRIVPIQSVRDKICSANKWLHYINKATFIGSINGGDSFSDIYGLSRFLLGVFPTITAILLKKEFILLPQTYGPFNSRVSKILARKIMNKAKLVYSRDVNSQSTTYSPLFVDKNTKIRFCADVAFCLNTKKINVEHLLGHHGSIPSRELIGFNISGLLVQGGYKSNNTFGMADDYKSTVFAAIKAIVHAGCTVMLIPHCFGPPGGINNDREACASVFSMLSSDEKKQVFVPEIEEDVHVVKGVIGITDFFIGSRMHSCIAALSQGIPAMAIAYSDKFTGVFASVGMADMVIDGRNTTCDDTVGRIIEGIKNKEAIACRLNDRMRDIREEIDTVFFEILQQNN
jgi:colanic acid/amylovoran biosynthesis protein